MSAELKGKLCQIEVDGVLAIAYRSNKTFVVPRSNAYGQAPLSLSLAEIDPMLSSEQKQLLEELPIGPYMVFQHPDIEYSLRICKVDNEAPDLRYWLSVDMPCTIRFESWNVIFIDCDGNEYKVPYGPPQAHHTLEWICKLGLYLDPNFESKVKNVDVCTQIFTSPLHPSIQFVIHGGFIGIVPPESLEQRFGCVFLQDSSDQNIIWYVDSDGIRHMIWFDKYVVSFYYQKLMIGTSRIIVKRAHGEYELDGLDDDDDKDRRRVFNEIREQIKEPFPDLYERIKDVPL